MVIFLFAEARGFVPYRNSTPIGPPLAGSIGLRIPPSLASQYPQMLLIFVFVCGGERIRTSGAVSRTPVFKTGAFIHSATPPSLKLNQKTRD